MKSLDNKQKHLIFKVVCSLVLCASLMCDMLMVGKILASDDPWTEQAGILLGISIILLGAYELLFFGYREVFGKSKFHYLHIVYAVGCFAAGIVSCAISKHYQLLGIVGTIYLCVPLLKRIISTIKRHSARKIVFNVMMGAVIIVLIVLSAITIGAEETEAFLLSGLMPSIIIALTCLVYICSLAFSNFNNTVLKKIIRKTYAGEVMFGLILLIVAFSMVLVLVEPGIETYPDALWYCFMLVTTIGFGDLTAVSTIGRVLSVILGLSGIVVVAIVTSIIVNFYNEVKNVKDNEDEADETSEPVEDANDDAHNDETVGNDIGNCEDKEAESDAQSQQE
ncbi:MAG: hypothetical protein IK048_01375 [Clostridia bacterium]|nr:hypothetical protein [Clostridia bacterium]